MRNKILLYSIGLLCVFIVISCSNKKEEALFVKNLASKCDFEEDSVILSISKITTFNWDTLYIIAPYTPKYEVNRILGFKYTDGNLNHSFVDDDSYTRFLFKKSDSIIKDFEVYDSDIGKSFGYLSDNTFSKGNAVFVSRIQVTNATF